MSRPRKLKKKHLAIVKEEFERWLRKEPFIKDLLSTVPRSMRNMPLIELREK